MTNYNPILCAKVCLFQLDEIEILRKKLIKKNKIIGNLQKANYSLKNLLNETLGTYKFPTVFNIRKSYSNNTFTAIH